MTKEELIQQIELQLHQQYAENNNSTLGSVIALFIAMLAVLAGYGVSVHFSALPSGK